MSNGKLQTQSKGFEMTIKINMYIVVIQILHKILFLILNLYFFFHYEYFKIRVREDTYDIKNKYK
jgi:hypothetical protein